MPYLSLEDVLTGLETLEQTLSALEDTRAAFAATYLLVSQQITQEIQANSFQNTAWMKDLTVHFANAYREAFWQTECNQSENVPHAWQASFLPEHRPLLSALLGVNAHINHDLAFSLVATGIKNKQNSKYQDHNLVNSILAQSINDIELKLASFDPNLQSLDESFGPLEEQVLLELLIDWREQAWQNALRLTSSQNNFDEPHTIWLINSYANNTAEHLHLVLSFLP